MLLTRTQRRREGMVVVAAAISLIAILSFVALSLDGGMLLDKRREAQAAADDASYAAACELYVNWFIQGGLDPFHTAKQVALQVAADHGFQDGVNGVAVTVNIPPLTGPCTGQNGHVEVKISAPQHRYFSKIFGSHDDVPVGARAVCRGMRSSVDNGILVLNPTL